MNLNYQFRSKDIFDPEKQKYKIHILGCGALGSWISLCLAKMGCADITLYDFDFVEELNIGSQLYKISDVDKPKTISLAQTIKEFSGTDIKAKNAKVTKDTFLNVSMNDIWILTFDDLENRKIFFDLIKDWNTTVIDVRQGGEEYNIQTVKTVNPDEVKKWSESFNIIETKLPCNAKTIVYVNMSVSSEVCNIIKKLNNGEKYPKKLIRHMKSYDIIHNQSV